MNQSIKNNLHKNMILPNLAENLGIKKLQAKISSLYGIEKLEEINLLTALLIEQLVDNLELIQKPTPTKCNNCFPLTCIPSLPIDFPQSAEMPLFLYGDKVSHESIEDYGIVIGRFYAIERISKEWRWKYLIFDNPDYTTDYFFSTCIYWETELEPLN
ncbi:MAG: hypothetical protein ACRC2S_20495 [Waterburya sp.]